MISLALFACYQVSNSESRFFSRLVLQWCGVMNWPLSFDQIPPRKTWSLRKNVSACVYSISIYVTDKSRLVRRFLGKVSLLVQRMFHSSCFLGVLRTFASFLTKIISYGVWLTTLWLWSDFKVSTLEYWHIFQSSRVLISCDLLFSSFNNLAFVSVVEALMSAVISVSPLKLFMRGLYSVSFVGWICQIVQIQRMLIFA